MVTIVPHLRPRSVVAALPGWSAADLELPPEAVARLSTGFDSTSV
jgi:hypothetical protein